MPPVLESLCKLIQALRKDFSPTFNGLTHLRLIDQGFTNLLFKPAENNCTLLITCLDLQISIINLHHCAAQHPLHLRQSLINQTARGICKSSAVTCQGILGTSISRGSVSQTAPGHMR